MDITERIAAAAGLALDAAETELRTRRSDGGGGLRCNARDFLSLLASLIWRPLRRGAAVSLPKRGATPPHTTYNTTRDEHTCLNF